MELLEIMAYFAAGAGVLICILGIALMIVVPIALIFYLIRGMFF